MSGSLSQRFIANIERSAGAASARALDDLLCALWVTGERPLTLCAPPSMNAALIEALAAVPARRAPVSMLDSNNPPADLQTGEVLLGIFDHKNPNLEREFALRRGLPILRIAAASQPEYLPAESDIAVHLPDIAQLLPDAINTLAGEPAPIDPRPAVFIDRDGVICENREDYVLTLEDFKLLPGVFAPLRDLTQAGWVVVVITNQSAVGRGLTTLDAVSAINRQMTAAVEAEGGRIDGVYLCPHAPEAGCNCRKPRPALLLRAARELNLDLSRSVMIGDAVSDVQAGLAAGCRPLLVLTGRGQDQLPRLLAQGYADVPVAVDLAEAVALITSG